ncbi:MAG: hypothetical protein HUU25_00945 [Candidatus Sumerlaeia bacterium]|nr:hypothetical protein [Candidatus Sumerlaeia bacterium]
MIEHYNLPEFVAFWIVWAALGLAAAAYLFWWALRTRQFEESRRAALIVLDDVPLESPGNSRGGRTIFRVMMAITVIGVAIVSYSVYIALRGA